MNRRELLSASGAASVCGAEAGICGHGGGTQETIKLLSPYAIFCHLKDMGVEEYQDEFLLSEVPLGEGVIDLKKRVDILRAKDPNMLFCLERQAGSNAAHQPHITPGSVTWKCDLASIG